jgi:hypothetical protein
MYFWKHKEGNNQDRRNKFISEIDDLFFTSRGICGWTLQPGLWLYCFRLEAALQRRVSTLGTPEGNWWPPRHSQQGHNMLDRYDILLWCVQQHQWCFFQIYPMKNLGRNLVRSQPQRQAADILFSMWEIDGRKLEKQRILSAMFSLCTKWLQKAMDLIFYCSSGEVFSLNGIIQQC